MRAKFTIKYEWESIERGFDMVALGESIIGFNRVLNEYFDASRMNGELEIRTLDVQKGSIELISVLDVIVSGYLFDSTQALYDFLNAADVNLYQDAANYFSQIGNQAKSVHDYLNEHEFDGALLIAMIVYMLEKQKDRKLNSFDRQLPARYANKLDQMKQSNIYRKALKPLTDGGFSGIKILSSERNYPRQVEITEKDLEYFLAEDQQILPEMLNGKSITVTASLKGLSSTRGEAIKLKINGIDPKHDLLLAHPADGMSTEDYRHLYGETVTVQAQVYRKSMYKKPELIVSAMEKTQGKLGL